MKISFAPPSLGAPALIDLATFFACTTLISVVRVPVRICFRKFVAFPARIAKWRWSAVENLLPSGCPATIRRFVISFVIDPFKSQTFWRVAHISEKILERLPALTNFYSASSVVTPRLRVGILTTFFHASPHSIDSTASTVVTSVAMRCGRFPVIFRSLASAGRRTAAQITLICNLFVTALATTKPFRLLRIGGQFSYERKVLKSSARLENKVFHARMLARKDKQLHWCTAP